MTTEINNTNQLNNIFFQISLQRLEEIRKNSTRFVHYTSAQSALSILKNKEVWMRNALGLNDYSEIRYGYELLRGCFSKELKPYLEQVLSSSNLKKFIEHFDSWTPDFLDETYLTCISEHSDGDEDKYGRLSMWRAFSNASGVALVLKNMPFLSNTNVLNTYISPVAYFEKENFNIEVQNLIVRMKQNESFLKEINEDVIKAYLFQALRFAILSTKHPCFKEEKEWRIIYSPTFESSDHLKNKIEIINGIPQKIYKIPLEDFSNHGLTGTTIPEILERVIIGPTQYPKIVSEAFIEILRKAGVDEPESKVFVSDLPLRN